MRVSVIVLLLSGLAYGQETVEDAINTIFSRNMSSGNSFWDQFEEVTSSPLRSISALTKCGEGDQKDSFACVPYYNCNSKTNLIQRNEEFDGTNRIDIRAGDSTQKNTCGHYLEVCCGVGSSTGTSPAISTQPTPPTPRSTTTSRTTTTQGSIVTPTNTTGTQAFCGIRNRKGIDFTLNGEDREAEFGEFPWMVAILRKNPSEGERLSLCGGSLITPTVILTGAHCVAQLDPASIKVRAGEWDTQTQNERIPYQERNINRIISHEYYLSGNLYNDVALLILDRPFSKTDSVGTICLPPQNQKFTSKECFATGWGKDIFGQEGRYSAILKKIQLPLVQNSDCQTALRTTRLGKSFILHRSFICAGGVAGVDTCTGDGGSPLVCPDPQNPNRYYQVGIVAWGIRCGDNQIPGVYADVTQFRNWIDTRVQELGLTTSPYSF